MLCFVVYTALSDITVVNCTVWYCLETTVYWPILCAVSASSVAECNSAVALSSSSSSSVSVSVFGNVTVSVFSLHDHQDDIPPPLIQCTGPFLAGVHGT